MKIIGIICEYNPLHNGHIYHLRKIKERYPDSLIILVLNGYFLQRGEISLLSKFDKTKLALQYGVNIVVELPVIFGGQSADTFAYKAVELLNKLGVEKIVFGSECDDAKVLKEIALEQLYSSDYQSKVKNLLDKGVNYPTALAKASNRMINKPNDLLGISYFKAIELIYKQIEGETIKRTSDYHDKSSDKEIISAENIREKLKKNNDICKYIPKDVDKYLVKVDEELLFKILKYRIMTSEDLSRYLDVDEGIENRIVKVIESVNSYEELIMGIKTKRYTYNKIKRMLCHILLGIKKEDAKIDLEYLRILGLDSIGQQYLKMIKKEIDIPMKVNKDSKTYQYELRAIRIYELLTNRIVWEEEKKNQPIRS